MTNEQRAAALRLADELMSPLTAVVMEASDKAAALLRAIAAEPVREPHPDYPCRSDGRCQYAIDHGAEGAGHCPKGKCVIKPVAEPVAWQCDYKHKAVAELRRLHAEVEECDALRAKLADILTRTAVALRGEPPPRTAWGWNDLPELVTALREAADDVLTFCGDAVDGWESLAPLRVRSAASESLLRLKAALEEK